MEFVTCTCCGAAVPQDEAYYVNDEPICLDCATAHTTICNSCGDRIWCSDDLGDDNISLCEDCFDRHYCRCTDCGRLIHNSCAFYMEDSDDENAPYCSECYHENADYLHCYSYKPEPVFYGDGPRYMGVELEIDEGGRDSDNARRILSVFNQDHKYAYAKTDGSLDDGIELVTHPCTLEQHLRALPWEAVLNKAKALGYYSHQSGTCGLHVHVSRRAFGTTEEEQEEHIGHILYLFERFWQELLRFSRRTQRQVDQWAARYGYKDTGKAILEDAKKSCKGRYTCVNLTNADTIEFRIFRGTLKYNTLIATLQFVNTLCNVAISLSQEQLQDMSWTDLMQHVDPNTTPELVQYLKERRLYINEPVTSDLEV